MKRGWLIFFCALCLCLFGCAAQSGGGDKPALPQPESTASMSAAQSAIDTSFFILSSLVCVRILIRRGPGFGEAGGLVEHPGLGREF